MNTNNNWIESLREITFNYDIDAEEALISNIANLMSNILTKKDQEHKAELETIKGEIEYSSSEQDTFTSEDAISIIDSHINKLSN